MIVGASLDKTASEIRQNLGLREEKNGRLSPRYSSA
jgi:hypothetical protein